MSYGRRGDPPIGDALAGNEFYIEQVVNDFSHTRVLEPLYEPLFARLRASPTVVPVVEAAAVIGRQMDRGLRPTSRRRPQRAAAARWPKLAPI